MMAPTLMLGDCLDRMREIPDGYVDLVLADPPYGTTACSWDCAIPFDAMWREVWRVRKPSGAAVFFGQQPFSAALIMSAPTEFRQALVWRKNKASGHLNAKRRHMTAHEDVLLFGPPKHTFNPQRCEGFKARNGWKSGGVSGVYRGYRSVEYAGTDETRAPTSVLSFEVVNNDGSNGGQAPPYAKANGVARILG